MSSKIESKVEKTKQPLSFVAIKQRLVGLKLNENAPIVALVEFTGAIQRLQGFGIGFA